MTIETGSRRHPSIQGSMTDHHLAEVLIEGTTIPITEAKVHHLQPGDLLVVTVSVPITEQQADQIKTRLQAAIGRTDIGIAIKTDQIELTHWRVEP